MRPIPTSAQMLVPGPTHVPVMTSYDGLRALRLVSEGSPTGASFHVKHPDGTGRLRAGPLSGRSAPRRPRAVPSRRPGTAPMNWARHGVALAERGDVRFAWTLLCCLFSPKAESSPTHGDAQGAAEPRRRRSRLGGGSPVPMRHVADRPRLPRGQDDREGKSEPHAAGFPTRALLTPPASRSTPGDPGGASPEPLPSPDAGLRPPAPPMRRAPWRFTCGVGRRGAGRCAAAGPSRIGRCHDHPMFHVKQPVTARERETPRCPARPRTG